MEAIYFRPEATLEQRRQLVQAALLFCYGHAEVLPAELTKEAPRKPADNGDRWPFLMHDGGLVVWPHLWYGFADSGGVYGSSSGYESAGLAMRAIWLLEPDVSAAINSPHLLGSVACCVLRGDQFVRRLYDIVEDTGNVEHVYGVWSKP